MFSLVKSCLNVLHIKVRKYDALGLVRELTKILIDRSKDFTHGFRRTRTEALPSAYVGSVFVLSPLGNGSTRLNSKSLLQMVQSPPARNMELLTSGSFSDIVIRRGQHGDIPEGLNPWDVLTLRALA